MKKMYFLLKGTFMLIYVPICISKGQRRRTMKQVRKVYAKAREV
jgi:hypothetical protein